MCIHGFRFSMSKKRVFEGQKAYVKGDWLLENLFVNVVCGKKLKDQKRKKFQFFRAEIQVIRLSEELRLKPIKSELRRNRSSSVCQAGAKLTTESSTDK